MSNWIINEGIHKGTAIKLQTVEQLHALQPGTKLLSIFGNEVTVGESYIDEDTRFGYVAYGVPQE